MANRGEDFRERGEAKGYAAGSNFANYGDRNATASDFSTVCHCGARRIDNQLGLEPIPEEHVAAMVGVFREVWRVMRDDATLWLNYGDSYAQSGRGGDPYGTSTMAGTTTSQAKSGDAGPRKPPPGLKPKDLVGMPWRVAFALQADGWYLRSDIIWSKPNPMPESVTDRPTKSHEHVFLLSKRPKYYYDADAVREAGDPSTLKMNPRYGRLAETGPYECNQRTSDDKAVRTGMGAVKYFTGTRNLRDVWSIATAPFPGSHFATFPPELVRPCVRAGTSEKGCCPECGAPWRRETGDAAGGAIGASWHDHDGDAEKGDRADRDTTGYTPPPTLGWSPTCECDAGEPVPAVVLDPFFGAGTVGLVAEQEGRDWVGIELNPEYAGLARVRLREQASAPVGKPKDGEQMLIGDLPFEEGEKP